MKQPVNTVKHVFVLYQLATVGLLDASLHSCDEAGLIFKHAGNSVFHQLLGVLAIGRGHLLEPRFNIGREMYFHTIQGTRKLARRQQFQNPRGVACCGKSGGAKWVPAASISSARCGPCDIGGG